MKKIKGSVKTLTPGVLFILFGIFTMFMIGFRAYLLMYVFEPDTGFYYIQNKDNIIIPVSYAVAAASCILYVVYCYLCPGFSKERSLGGKNYYLATASAVMSVTLVIDSMRNFSEMFNGFNESEIEVFSEYLVASKSVPLVFEILLALISALYFIILSVSHFTGSNAYLSARVMSLTPSCWFMCRLIVRFVKPISFINYSELFWEIVMVTLLMIFFMGFARITSNINKDGKFNFTAGVGFCGAMISAMISLSRIFTCILASPAYLSKSSPIEACDLPCAAFVIIFLISCIRDLSPKKKESKFDDDNGSDNKTEQVRTVTVVPSSSADDEAFKIAEEYSNRYIKDTSAVPAATENIPAAEANDIAAADTGSKAEDSGEV